MTSNSPSSSRFVSIAGPKDKDKNIPPPSLAAVREAYARSLVGSRTRRSLARGIESAAHRAQDHAAAAAGAAQRYPDPGPVSVAARFSADTTSSLPEGTLAARLVALSHCASEGRRLGAASL